MASKSQYLQIRVTPRQKATIRRLARSAGTDISDYVLARALPGHRIRFRGLLERLASEEGEATVAYPLAELNDLLTGLTGSEFVDATENVEECLLQDVSPLLRNYVAAMVELAAHQKGVAVPAWTGRVRPLEVPYFAVPWASLRPHLLRNSPVPFKRRNLFVDSAVGDRV